MLHLDLARFSASRDEVVAALRAENIGAAAHYRALHLEPYYAALFRHPPEKFPHALEAGRSLLTLPLGPSMSDADAGDVLRATVKVLSRYLAAADESSR